MIRRLRIMLALVLAALDRRRAVADGVPYSLRPPHRRDEVLDQYGRTRCTCGEPWPCDDGHGRREVARG